MIKCWIVDIDGTVANNEHRIHYITNGHKNWSAWHANAHKDEPIEQMVELLDMAVANDIKIVLCTARDEHCREDTVKWFEQNNIPYAASGKYTVNYRLNPKRDLKPMFFQGNIMNKAKHNNVLPWSKV